MAKKVVFIFNSDYGQANPFLATIYAFVMHAPDVEVHIASFHELEPRVNEIREQISKVPGASSRPIMFHGMDGMPQFERSCQPDVDVMETWDRPLTFLNAARSLMLLPSTVMPWTPDEFISIYRACERIIADIKADLIVTGPLLSPTLTLCRRLGLKWIVQTPNTIKDFVAPLQPKLAMLWKYPLVNSGHLYPMSWPSVLRNIVLALVAGYALLTDTRGKKLTEQIRKTIDPKLELFTAQELGVIAPPPPGVRIMVNNAPDLDYPFEFLPDHIMPVGPIIRPAVDVNTADPSLAAWLSRGPTILVVLGTHLRTTTAHAVEMAKAFKDLLVKAEVQGYGGEEGQKLQILWKLLIKKKGSEEASHIDCIRDILGPEMDEDRVRITEWLSVEPYSVLKSGAIVLSVHHGGASAFNETLCAGIPHVILPGWADCFDYGNRAEMLGVGRWANKKSLPRWERNELAAGLVDVLLGPEADQFCERARELAKKYPESAGRERAASEILAALDEEK